MTSVLCTYVELANVMLCVRLKQMAERTLKWKADVEAEDKRYSYLS